MGKLHIEKPKQRMGIYAWINKEEMKVYVGESCNMNRRICEHIFSMYDYENSSNANLVRAFKNGATLYGVVLKNSKSYSKDFYMNEKIWIYDETIYMYEFVKRGYHLYNGSELFVGEEYPKTLTDNEKGLRSFLRGSEDVIENELETYCNIKGFSLEHLKAKKEEAKKEVEKALDRIENNDLEYYITKESQIRTVCGKISKAYIQSEDAEAIGLSCIPSEKILSKISNDEFEKIAICGFGDYLDQSAVTILATKQYDIEHNSFKVTDRKVDIFEKNNNIEQKGICFWAYGRANTDEYRTYLSKNEEERKPRYLLLPYTTSNLYAKSNTTKKNQIDNKICFDLQEDDSMEDLFMRINDYKRKKEEVCNYNDKEDRMINDIFVKEFAWNRKDAKKADNRISYPKSMFPEIVKKVTKKNNILREKNNVAFLISQICYLDIQISIKQIEEYFTSNTNKNLVQTMKGSNNVSCATLTDKKGFMEYISKCNELKKTDNDIKLFIAKLEYPYVVALI